VVTKFEALGLMKNEYCCWQLRFIIVSQLQASNVAESVGYLSGAAPGSGLV